jgi:hypothetical protein
MKHSWQEVVDIIPVKMLDAGIEVLINDRNGLIYEQSNAWVLMLAIKPETNFLEDKWLTITCLLLSSYGELGYGLSSFQNRWWLSCRYGNARDVADVTDATAVQLSVANFIEKWPELMLCQQDSIGTPLTPVINKWA